MAATPYEYHNNTVEYFPMHDPVKGRKRFGKVKSGASGIMATASAGIISAAVTLLLLFCSATVVGASSASFRITVCNADDSTHIHYYVIPYNTVSQNMEIYNVIRGGNTGTDTANLFTNNSVASGPVPSGTDTFQVDGLESNTRYIIVFININPDGVQFLNALEFCTRGPNSDGEPPEPEITIPTLPQEEDSTAEETIPETVPETTEETETETEPEPTEAPAMPPAYIPPPEEEPVMPPAEPTTPPDTEPTTPPDTEPTTPPDAEPTTPPDVEPTTPPDAEPTTPPDAEPTPPPEEEPDAAEMPQGQEIIIGEPTLPDNRTKYNISTEMDMKEYSAVGAEIRLEGSNATYDELSWNQSGSTVTVSGDVYLEATTNVQIVVIYNDNNGGTAEVSSDPATLEPLPTG